MSEETLKVLILAVISYRIYVIIMKAEEIVECLYCCHVLMSLSGLYADKYIFFKSIQIGLEN